jgi:Mg-chelatase subunit ChlI
MIAWLNGPFGGGKTVTARELDALLPEEVAKEIAARLAHSAP